MSGQNGGSGETKAPGLLILGQYVKDLSFENPNAPQSLMAPPQQQPAIDIQINVNAKALAENDFEVELSVEVKAEDKTAKRVLFVLELVYAGVFRLSNVPKENVQPLVLIECPRQLFPFVRQIVAESVSSGGFPPIMLQPVDFGALYQAKMVGAAGAPGAAKPS
ncbi:MAG: protein-export chaperone SecB [Xanthobacteraceae bacterium]|mgnify:CR=1 FL=1|nr:protein-export chaperone SecB [Xanthobacteraceae bacterium]QYK44994.1 MAG: protein-export chaperone SecB [Xanthobacteraceae bacterium]